MEGIRLIFRGSLKQLKGRGTLCNQAKDGAPASPAILPVCMALRHLVDYCSMASPHREGHTSTLSVPSILLYSDGAGYPQQERFVISVTSDQRGIVNQVSERFREHL